MVKGLSGILYFCKTEYPCEVLITKNEEIVFDEKTLIVYDDYIE